jgi:hypothetical protein
MRPLNGTWKSHSRCRARGNRNTDRLRVGDRRYRFRPLLAPAAMAASVTTLGSVQTDLFTEPNQSLPAATRKKP